MGIALPIEKMSRKEKFEAMESLWDDLCRHAEKVQSPAWHGAILEQREEDFRVGEADLSDWDVAKKHIRKECIFGGNLNEDSDKARRNYIA